MPNLSFTRKILIAVNVLLIASFLIKEYVSFPFLNKIRKYLRGLVVPCITIIISISEGPGEPNPNNSDNQGNNVEIEENANDLANARINQEAIRPAPAKQLNKKQLSEDYD